MRVVSMTDWFFFLGLLFLFIFTGIVATFSPTTFYWIFTKIGRGVLISKSSKTVKKMLDLIDTDPDAFSEQYPGTIMAVRITGIASIIVTAIIVLLLLSLR